MPGPITDAALAALAEDFAGELIGPDHHGYDEARRIWNGSIDRRPGLIARCSGVADVVSVVRVAAAHDVTLAVRGGGHSFPGLSVCDGGLVLDLSAMSAVRIDPVGRTAWAQGGATWGGFDREAHLHGLATPGGLVSSTGVTGLTLGGGIGWLNRPYGLSCDNVLSAEVVTATGEVLHTGPDEHPDLFWALRGGGGNFGVVTGLEFRLHPVDTVLVGVACYRADDLAAVVRGYADACSDLPNEVTSLIEFAPVLAEEPFPQEHWDIPSVSVYACHATPGPGAEEVLGRFAALADPVFTMTVELPYPALQQMSDTAVPHGKNYYGKAVFLDDITGGALDALQRHALAYPGLAGILDIHHMGGAIAAAAPTAFPHRDAPWAAVVLSMTDDATEHAAGTDWVRSTFSALAEHSRGTGYVNWQGDEDAVDASYTSEALARLAAVKAKYDPTNLFRLNQNIAPAG